MTITCPTPLVTRDKVLLGHGSGGKLSADLMRSVFMPAYANATLERMDDQAIVSLNRDRIAFTTDSFVVKPLFFRGGDIGSLAVHGTVNDLAMGGAIPMFLSAAFIIEEGFPIESLHRIASSLGRAADACGVQVVTGDTKVVDKGSGDGVFINTTGLGLVPEGISFSANQARPGDAVILSGSIGEHGIAILAEREGLEFDTPVESDSAPLHNLVREMLAVTRSIRVLRDPTRGGLSSTLNEIAQQSRVGIRIEERKIPIREDVHGACEMLGLDPLYVANEGKLVAIVAAEVADLLVDAMRLNPLGKQAQIIGTVTDANPGWVGIRTGLGTSRVVDMLSGDQLPRIC
jgi:hydrogenase expression/formation protein HypE